MTQAISIPSQTHSTHGTEPSPQTAHPDSAGPLSPEHRQQIAQAQQRQKKIKRATHVAAFNAWSFAIFAGFSLLMAVFSPAALIGASVLAALAWNEFRGRRQLQQLDPLGANTLGVNQLACCAAIALYCCFKIAAAMTGPGPYAQAMQDTPEIAPMLEPMQELMRNATMIAYAVILVVGVGLQGATAWYYFTRKRWVHDYRKQTPAWIVELERGRSAGH